MPLYQTLNSKGDTTITVWRITESEAELRSGIELGDNSLQRLSRMSSAIHRKGFLSIRHLLALHGLEDTDVVYNDLGKPTLLDGRYISITHSFEYTAVVVSKNPVGIDIEKRREKIARIAHKFIGSEAGYLQSIEDQIEELTIIWGAKESMYKLFGTKGLAFKENCHVMPFSIGDKQTVAEIRFQDSHLRYSVFFSRMGEFNLVYVLPL